MASRLVGEKTTEHGQVSEPHLAVVSGGGGDGDDDDDDIVKQGVYVTKVLFNRALYKIKFKIK